METVLSSAAKTVKISDKSPTVIIGERINPSGKKKMSEALKNGDMEIIRNEATAQVAAGADVLDVNVNIFGIDEAALLSQAVKTVMETVDAPLCIDSNNVDSVAAALKVYKGKALINSVTGEERSLTDVLALAKEYNAAVIGLVQDEEGIPKTVDKRLEVAHKIVDRAAKVGIPPEDIVLDCLVLAIGANSSSGLDCLETILRVRAELGVNITLAASNISFGMPERALLTGTFVATAIAAGATSVIADAAKIRPNVLAADLVAGKDQRARRYITGTKTTV